MNPVYGPMYTGDQTNGARQRAPDLVGTSTVLDPPPVIPPGLHRIRQRLYTDFSFNWAKSVILIISLPSSEIITQTTSSVRFIQDSVAFAFMVVIFPLCEYSFILWILIIYLLLALELEPFDLPP